MADIIIKTENLCFEYDENDGVKKHPVLRSMNLEIERGSFTAILGHNGSGKSTLAKRIIFIIFCMLPYITFGIFISWIVAWKFF